MRRLLRHTIKSLILLAGLTACHPLEEPQGGNRGNFEALWQTVDEHYCFFAEKEIDWQAIHDRYAPAVTPELSRSQLFGLCARMLNELRDGHTNLSSSFETSYYREWWSAYPQNFNLRIIQENYLNFDYRQLGGVIYGMLAQNVGYVHIPSFSSGLSSGNINNVLADLLTANGLIIDLRDNGGGSMSYAEEWVRHFTGQPLTVGYMQHKTGPGHDDFSTPFPIEFKAPAAGSIVWVKPVVILTNRSTFSAANYMVMCMKELPQVIHAGAVTGGGGGMPMSFELPGGWNLRMSAVKVLDVRGETTEFGIAPDEGFAVDMDPQAEANGRDSMLDFAINAIK